MDNYSIHSPSAKLELCMKVDGGQMKVEECMTDEIVRGRHGSCRKLGRRASLLRARMAIMHFSDSSLFTLRSLDGLTHIQSRNEYGGRR